MSRLYALQARNQCNYGDLSFDDVESDAVMEAGAKLHKEAVRHTPDPKPAEIPAGQQAVQPSIIRC